MAYQWAKHLSEQHDVTLLTYHKRGAQPASEQLPGVRVVEWIEPPFVGRVERLNSIVKPAYLPFYFRARRWVSDALARGERFDIAHQPVPVAMRYPSPAVGLGIPLVIGPVGGGLSSPAGFAADEGPSQWFMALRNLDSYRLRWDPLLRRTFREADCVLGIAPYVLEQLDNIPLRRLEIMSETGLESLPESIDRQNRSGPVRLLYVGRLVRTKGARDIIRALALVPDLPVILDIVGDGPERTECEDVIRELDLSDRVVLHGSLPKDEVFGFYRRTDVFVFPSYREAGGNVALEAMGFSLPLIVVDRGGPGSAVNDSCAIKLRANTPDQLSSDIAKAITTLATNVDLRHKMGAAAHEYVGRTALWSAKIDIANAIYESVIGSAG